MSTSATESTEGRCLEELAGRLGGRRLAVVGDIRRNGYDVACRLRQLGLDLEVFGRSSDLKYLEEGPPPWYHVLDTGLCDLLGPGRPLLHRLRRDFDLIHARAGGVLFAPIFGCPYVAQAVGGDLRAALSEHGPRGFALRRGFRRCHRFFVSRVDVLDAVPADWPQPQYLPVVVNTDFMAPPAAPAKPSAALTVFHASLHDWTLGSPISRRNDILLRGFAAFLQLGHPGRLILVGRGASWPDTERLLAELDLQAHTTVVEEQDQEGLRRHYQHADVVVDHFSNGGVPGLCTWDAMACQRPVICRTDAAGYRRLCGEAPPTLSCADPEETCQALVRLRDADVRRRIGEASRAWVMQVHGWEAVAPRLLDAYAAAVSARRVDGCAS